MIYFIVIMDYEYGNNFIFKKKIFFFFLYVKCLKRCVVEIDVVLGR